MNRYRRQSGFVNGRTPVKHTGLWLGVVLGLMQWGCSEKVSEDSVVKQPAVQAPVEIRYVPVLVSPQNGAAQLPPNYVPTQPAWNGAGLPQAEQGYRARPDTETAQTTGNPWAARPPGGSAAYEVHGIPRNGFAPQYNQGQQAVPDTRFRPLEPAPPQPAARPSAVPAPTMSYGWGMPAYVAPYDRPIGSSRSQAGMPPGYAPGHGAAANVYPAPGYAGGYGVQPGFYSAPGYYGGFPLGGTYPGAVLPAW